MSPGVKPMITINMNTTQENKILEGVKEFLKRIEQMKEQRF